MKSFKFYIAWVCLFIIGETYPATKNTIALISGKTVILTHETNLKAGQQVLIIPIKVRKK